MCTQRRVADKRPGLVLIITLLAALVGVSPVWAGQSPQVRLDASTIPQFAQPLPLLNIVPLSGNPNLPGIETYVGSMLTEVHLCEFDASVLPPGTPVKGTGKTRSWGI